MNLSKNFVALIALLSCPVWAANFPGRSLINNSVREADLQDSSVTSPKIKNGEIQGVDIDATTSIQVDTMTLTGNAFSVGASTLVVTGGKVGIGTTAPATKLHISSGTLLIDGTSPVLRMATNDEFIIDSSGFIGIGTTSPGFALTTNGSETDTNTIQMSRATGNKFGPRLDLQKARGLPGSEVVPDLLDEGGAIRFRFWDGDSYSTGGEMKVIFNGTAVDGIMPGDFTFATQPQDVAGRITRMVITSTGNVGIGTTSPGSALEVVGQIRHSLGIISTGTGNGSVAGDPRGLGAIDLQTIRISADQVASGDFSTISGGEGNLASGIRSTVGGGNRNTASQTDSTVAGGDSNTAGGPNSVVGGGDGNTAVGIDSTVSGGSGNTASEIRSTVSGGDGNTASGVRSTVPGGFLNTASGDDSFAAGRQAKATTKGSFVWADSQGVDLVTSATDQFLVRAQGGFTIDSSSATFTGLVGIGTTDPGANLQVVGASGDVLIVSSGTAASQKLWIFEAAGDLLPGTSAQQNIGSPSAPIKEIFVGEQSIQFVDSSGVVTSSLAISGSGELLFDGFPIVDSRVQLDIESSELPADGHASTYVNVPGDTMTGTLTLSPASGDALLITAGKVGIGTAGPLSKLAVAQAPNTGTIEFRLGSNDASARDIIIRKDTTTPFETHFISAANPTVDAGTLRFFTSDQASGERMVIQFSGNVGIGTTNPSSALHVSSAATSATTPILIVSSGTGAGQELLRVRGDGNVGIGTTSPGRPLHIVDDRDFLARFESTDGFSGISLRDNSTTAGDQVIVAAVGDAMRLRTLNTDRMAITSAGNIGFGITNPSSIVHIKANTPGTVGDSPALQLIIQHPSTDVNLANAGITLYNSDVSGNPDKQLAYFGSSSGSNKAITLLNRQNDKLTLGTNGLTRLTIDSNGDVGIGIASPGAKLDIAGNIKIADGTQDPGKVLTSDAAGLARWDTVVTAGITDGAVTNAKLLTDSGSMLKVSGGAMFSDGTNVGIGTTNPGSLLEVNGEMRAGQRTSADCCSDTPQRIGEFCYDTGLSDMFFSTGTVADQYKQVVGTANCG